MAKSKRSSSSRPGLWLALLAVLAIGATLYAYRTPISGYAGVSTAYAARVACSCRFVAGRDLADCEKDKLAGMEMVTLRDDEQARSVTARFPLIESSTATYREGYGCMLESWEG